jgi:hypothetical protein
MGKSGMIAISDNALLRHLERAEGINVEAIRLDLQARFSPHHEKVILIGVENYSIRSEDLSYIVRGGTVTTVLPKLGQRSRYFSLDPRRTLD